MKNKNKMIGIVIIIGILVIAWVITADYSICPNCKQVSISCGQICNNCGKQMEHSWNWECDEEMHNAQCKYCKEWKYTKMQFHSFDDGVCTECNYKCQHQWEWEYDEKSHNAECTICYEKKYWEDTSHTFSGQTDTCTICGYNVNGDNENDMSDLNEEVINSGKAHTHTPKSTYESNDTYHWKTCIDTSCKAIIEGTKEKHIFLNGECKCGFKYDTTSDKILPDTGASRVVIVAMGVIGLVVVGVIKMKKYKDI